jgi:hypothetical protein
MHELTLRWIFYFYKVSADLPTHCHTDKEVTVYREVEDFCFYGSKQDRVLQIVPHSRDVRFSAQVSWHFKSAGMQFRLVTWWHVTTSHKNWTFNVTFICTIPVPVNIATWCVHGEGFLKSKDSKKINKLYLKKADPCGREVLSVGLRLFACWNCGFESRWGHGCSSLVFCVVQEEASAKGRSLVQGNPTGCVRVIECDQVQQ